MWSINTGTACQGNLIQSKRDEVIVARRVALKMDAQYTIKKSRNEHVSLLTNCEMLVALKHALRKCDCRPLSALRLHSMQKSVNRVGSRRSEQMAHLVCTVQRGSETTRCVSREFAERDKWNENDFFGCSSFYLSNRGSELGQNECAPKAKVSPEMCRCRRWFMLSHIFSHSLLFCPHPEVHPHSPVSHFNFTHLHVCVCALIECKTASIHSKLSALCACNAIYYGMPTRLSVVND